MENNEKNNSISAIKRNNPRNNRIASTRKKTNQGQKTNKVNTKERTLQEITQDLKNAKMQKENVNVPKTEKVVKEKVKNLNRPRKTRQLANKKEETGFKFKKEKLKIIPLGGIQEIGKNITVFEYGDDIVVVDCGLAFPEDDMLGIDLVIPDFSYLEKNQLFIYAILLLYNQYH